MNKQPYSGEPVMVTRPHSKFFKFSTPVRLENQFVDETDQSRAAIRTLFVTDYCENNYPAFRNMPRYWYYAEDEIGTGYTADATQITPFNALHSLKWHIRVGQHIPSDIWWNR